MAFNDNLLNNNEKYIKNRAFDTGRIYLARVKDVRNKTGANEIKVWILNSNYPEDDWERWIIAKHCSSFFGYSPAAAGNIDYKSSPTSFGLNLPLPFINNYVFIFFPICSGENVLAYWFGSPEDYHQNNMIPGIPGKFTNDDHEPFTELNFKNDSAKAVGIAPVTNNYAKIEEQMATYDPLKTALEAQGLAKDRLRGISTSGVKRETPSKAYGLLTPLGNSFTIDDGWSLDDNKQEWNSSKPTKDELLQLKNGVLPNKQNWKAELSYDGKAENAFNRFQGGYRLRTRSGTQIIIFDCGIIYLINKDGTAWVELSDDGYIDCYSKMGINASSEGDINVYSKKDINIQADNNVNIRANNSINIQANKLFQATAPEYRLSASMKIDISSPTTNINNVVNANVLNTQTINSGTVTSYIIGNISGKASYADTAGEANEGSPKPVSVETKTPKKVNPISAQKILTHTIVGKGDEKITDVINTRIPTHEPYKGHDKNQFIPKLNISRNPPKEKETTKDNTVKSDTINKNF